MFEKHPDTRSSNNISSESQTSNFFLNSLLKDFGGKSSTTKNLNKKEKRVVVDVHLLTIAKNHLINDEKRRIYDQSLERFDNYGAYTNRQQSSNGRGEPPHYYNSDTIRKGNSSYNNWFRSTNTPKHIRIFEQFLKPQSLFVLLPAALLFTGFVSVVLEGGSSKGRKVGGGGKREVEGYWSERHQCYRVPDPSLRSYAVCQRGKIELVGREKIRDVAGED